MKRLQPLNRIRLRSFATFGTTKVRSGNSHHLYTSPIPTQSPLLPFFTSRHTHINKDDSNKDMNEQKRLANLGAMNDYLLSIIPDALNTVPNSSEIDENIQLRISPTISPAVPIIKGRLSYLTSLKATQLIFKNFVLDPRTKIHILRMEVARHGSDYGILGADSTKIVMRWKTCEERCHHLTEGDNATTGESDDKHRVLSGIFVFELNLDNDKILVHNVESLEICDDHERKLDDVFGGNFAKC